MRLTCHVINENKETIDCPIRFNRIFKVVIENKPSVAFIVKRSVFRLPSKFFIGTVTSFRQSCLTAIATKYLCEIQSTL